MRTPFFMISLALGLLAAAAHGDDISPTINEYAVYTDGNATLTGRTHITGQLGAGGSLTLNDDSTFSEGVLAGGSLSARYRIKVEGILHAGGSMSVLHDSVIGGSVQSGGSMSIADRVNIGGDVHAAGAMSLSPHAIVGGEVYPYAAPPRAWVRPIVSEPDFSPGSTQVRVNDWQSRQQNPGNYGVLELGNGSTIHLSSGDYHFSSINAKTDSVFQIDDSDGPVNMYVSGTVLLDHRAVINLASESPGNLTWFVGGNMTVRTDINLPGHVRCFGTVAVADRVHSRGSIYAKDGFSNGWDCTFKIVELPSVYFVGPNGSDSNSGQSPAQALRTIQAGVERCARPGVTVYVAPGVYAESVTIRQGEGSAAVSGDSQSPVSLIADTTGVHTGSEPGPVVIEGNSSRQTGIKIDSIEHWLISDFTLRNQTQHGVLATDAGFDLRGCDFDVPRDYAVSATAAGDISVSDCVFKRGDDSGNVISITAANDEQRTAISVLRNDLSMRGDLYQSTGFEHGQSTLDERTGDNKYIVGISINGGQNAMVGPVEISNNQISDCSDAISVAAFNDSGCDLTIANNTITGSLVSIGVNVNALGAMRVLNSIVDRCHLGVVCSVRSSDSYTVAGILENEISGSMFPYQRPYELDVISAAPIFADAAGGNFALRKGSPGIDAGTEIDAPGTDIASFSRPVDGDGDGIAQIDLGAYEQVAEPDHVKVVRWREVGAESER